MSEQRHPLWSLSLSPGELLLCPCPGTQQVPLAESLQQLKDAGAAVLVTLMTADELAEHGVADLPGQAEAAGLQWLHLPVEDEAVPDQAFETQWQRQSAALHQVLDRQQAVAIHCRGGAGRTGLVAARLMIERGLPVAEVIPAIQVLRPRAFFYPAQREYVTALTATEEVSDDN